MNCLEYHFYFVPTELWFLGLPIFYQCYVSKGGWCKTIIVISNPDFSWVKNLLAAL